MRSGSFVSFSFVNAKTISGIVLFLVLLCSLLLQSPATAQDRRWLEQNQRGMQAMSRGDYRAAEKALTEAMDTAQALDDGAMELAASLNNLGLIYQQSGRYDEAEVSLRRALELRLKVYGPRHRYFAQSLNSLARLLQDQQKLTEAERLFESALDVYAELFGPGHPLVADTLNNLGSLHRSTQRYQSAERYLKRALEIQQSLFGPRHPRVTTTISNLASLAIVRGDSEQAVELYRRVIDIRLNAKPVNFNGLVIALNNLGVIHQGHCRYRQATVVLEQAFEIITRQFAGRHAESGRIQYRLGVIAAAGARLSQAQQLFESALQDEAEITDPEHQRLLPIIDAYADLLERRRRPEQARQQRQRARQIRQDKAVAPEIPQKPGCGSQVV